MYSVNYTFPLLLFDVFLTHVFANLFSGDILQITTNIRMKPFFSTRKDSLTRLRFENNLD